MIKNIFLDGLVLAVLFLLTMSGLSNKRLPEIDMVNEEIVGLEPIVVLELFTSQGCSSCPAADELLEKIKNEHPDNVFALSYHVDYWNYIGWEDPFSNKSFVKKQSFYNIKFNNRSNYTPQLVVNGKEHFVGSDARKLNSSVENYMSVKPKNSIKLFDVKKSGEAVAFDYEVTGNMKHAGLRAVLALDKRTTDVKRGENRRRTLSNTNIVIAEKYIELDASRGTTVVEVPAIAKKNEKIHLILLLENEDKDILTAVKAALLN